MKIGKVENGALYFSELDIYELIREILKFRFDKKTKKFFKMRTGLYRPVKFQDIKDDFYLFIENNFDKIEVDGEISKDDFKEEYYSQKPIKDGDFIRTILSKEFELIDYNEHQSNYTLY